MATAMAVENNNPNSFDWANDTYMALDDSPFNASDKWAPFSQPPQSMPPSAFTFPPSLLTQASIERFGQVTPPEELSPASPRPESAKRESSIPVEQLHKEASWPAPQQIQALADYDPALQDHQRQSHQHPQQQPTPENQHSPPAKRRRTSKQPSTNQSQPSPTSQQTTEVNPQAPKRKRGRPKSQPQMVETFTADGYPLQVSSARQSHLEKNRVAAHKCRQRKKEYIGGLEGRARQFSAKNKALKDNVALLRDEVLALKNEVLRHAGCGFWAVDEYLAQCAGDLLGLERPALASGSRQPSLDSNSSPTMSTMDPNNARRASSAESLPSQGNLNSPEPQYEGFDFLEDMDEDIHT